MENIIITRPHETVTSLAELAVQINAEHGHVETAIRDGLAHARQAGLLLIQAKTRVPHGNWLPWLTANCKTTARTAQRYIKIAEYWDEIVAKGGDGLGLRGALKLLTSQKDELPNATRVSYLPPALDYYHQNGLITEDALRQLLDLERDYGPEILTEIRFSSVPEVAGVHEPTWWFLNAIRPLDHPSLWPFIVSDFETAGASAVTAATRIFFDDGRARGDKVPQWEVTAFWFGSTMVHLADRFPAYGERFASILHHHLAVWRESFRAALMCVCEKDILKCEDENEERQLWWGYKSDLRHAGVSRAVEEMQQNPISHPTLHDSLIAGFDDSIHLGSYPTPSNMQGRLDHCTEAEGELEQPDDTPRGDAPDDELFAEPDTEAAE